jgi:anti-anti-sigma regulatory factor
MMATAAHPTSMSARFAIPQLHDSHHAKALRARVHEALTQGDRHLVVDCGAWNRLELNMLSSLIQCASACREHGASFEVANMSSEVRADVHALQLSGRLGLPE